LVDVRALQNFIHRWNAHNAEDPDDPEHHPIWPRPFYKVVVGKPAAGLGRVGVGVLSQRSRTLGEF
jgi:hypothetical protein